MRLFFLLAIIAIIGLFAISGCASLGLAPPTTQPATPQERLAAAQKDLTDGLRIATAIHLATPEILSDKQFKFIETQYPLAQDAINLADVALADKQPDALALLENAAQAVHDFRARAKK